MVALGHPAQPARRPRPACGSSRTTSACPTRPTRSTPRSASPTSCRTCSAKACSRRRSSRCTRGCSARATRPRRGRWRARSGRLLALVMAVLVLLGVVATPLLIDLIAPGFDGAKRELTIRLVRILFPGAGLLVLSAWCLGVLNSHGGSSCRTRRRCSGTSRSSRRCCSTAAGSANRNSWSRAAWGSVLGARCSCWCSCRRCTPSAGHARRRSRGTSAHVRTVTRNFVPAFLSRGVVQISAYVDTAARDAAARPARWRR